MGDTSAHTGNIQSWAVPRSTLVLFFVLDLVMMTRTRQYFILRLSRGLKDPLTILVISLDHDVTLGNQTLQTGTLRCE